MKLKQIGKQTRQQLSTQALTKKIETAKKVIRQAVDDYGWDSLAVAWTGGKDSTLLLWLIKEVAEESNQPLPVCLFIDEGDVFDEIRDFATQLTADWNLTVETAHNSNVSELADDLGATVKVKDLNKRNQQELNRLGFSEDTFEYYPESYVGNHLMKTVATNMWLEKNPHIKALLVGVRWDEQGARAEDDFIREINDPPHHRVEPILAFAEKDVWDAIKTHKIPYVSLYEKGYRSLGAKTSTDKTSNQPAWEQDLENTTERAGRQQDKEKIMHRLRDLGYM